MKFFEPVGFAKVDITGGFWRARQETNATVTVYSVLERFRETYRFDAFKFDWREGQPGKPHIFYDSDVAKWMEAAAYILEKRDDPELERVVDETVDLIEAHQEPDGYFNVYFTVVEPGQRFTRRTDHELYCAGHLIEAAIAYNNARGKDKFLRLMEKYVDCIERAFVTENTAAFATPGHEEIELALCKLYAATGEKRYLALAKHFVDARGVADEKTYRDRNSKYMQNHLPVREQTTAEGHSVRAVYLYSGMADVALATGDEDLKRACETLFDNIAEKRMYVTGGIGSTRIGEAFTIDYDLPGETAYAETCAAIGLALFAKRMLAFGPDARYADVAERALYNGFLSGLSLDGKSFFYENPLEINLANRHRHASDERGETLAATRRAEVFSCSCCPPNVTRFIASLGDMLYSRREREICVHHYMESEASFDGATIRQRTGYPFDGNVSIDVSGAEGCELLLRVPGWCDAASFKLNGAQIKPAIERGYARIALAPGDNEIELDLPMEFKLVEARAEVRDAACKAALTRGPLVYCAEAVDNSAPLSELMLDLPLTAREAEVNGLPIRGARVAAHARAFDADSPLYRPLRSELVATEAVLIPFFAFANRDECDMRVWLNVKR